MMLITYDFISLDEVISNDPIDASKELLKSWEDPIGSIRLMTGASCKPVEVQVEVDWDKAHVAVQRRDMEGQQADANTTDVFAEAKWNKIQAVNVEVEHVFELGKEIEEAQYLTFTVKNVPKSNFSLSEPDGKIETKPDFR